MKKVIDKFERFGRAFLVPVAILPFVGLLLALGSAFSSTVIIKAIPLLDWPLINFTFGLLKAVGKSMFSNLPLIFAAGLAIGLSKREKGAAAISGLVGYIAMIYTLNYTLSYIGGLAPISEMAANSQKMVLGKQVTDVNVFGGIIVGLLSYYANKTFIDSKLPVAFSFFEGPRLVPLVSICFSVIAGVLLAFIWPYVSSMITSFSTLLASLGSLGAFFYGAIERLLIPFGLHHALNAMLKYLELGGSASVCGETFYGYINMFAGTLACEGAKFTPEMTKFYSGQFVVKMFGLPAAALAMYHTSFLIHRPKIKAMLIGAAVASFLTGITEPIEFTFLFVAPVLYVVHAVLAGSAFFLMYITDTVAFAIQGAGLINFVLYDVLNSTRADWFNLLWIGPFYSVLYYFAFKFLIIKFNFKTPGRDENSNKLSTKKEAKEKYGIGASKVNNKDKDNGNNYNLIANKLIKAHGGSDNILEVNACYTRLRINVKDKSLVDKDIIKDELQAMGVAVSGDQIQSIYGGDAKTYKTIINDMLGVEE